MFKVIVFFFKVNLLTFEVIFFHMYSTLFSLDLTLSQGFSMCIFEKYNNIKFL